LLAAAVSGSRDVPAKLRAKLADAAGYLAVAPTVVRVAVDAPVKLSRPDVVPVTPADPDRVAKLAERWNLGNSVTRLLAALER
jgi:hypothetical protein